MAVWKCIKCNQVFATPASANAHSDSCPSAGESTAEQTETEDNGNVEKVLTELLLQCEFCNRTYAEKSLLSAHQRTHTTSVNYECVTCKETFESYTLAAKHWLTKCTDEANLFYLPKLTYCEFCDRTFKSHEILYAHKIKKKHYTPKVHEMKAEESSDEPKIGGENKDAIVKLIEDVLTTLNTSLDEHEENKEACEANRQMKTEVLSQNEIVSVDEANDVDDSEKKKRGRKRKTGKQPSKPNKKLSAAIEKGCMYQCERCIKVFDSVGGLEQHREKEHAANYTCEQCKQVRI